MILEYVLWQQIYDFIKNMFFWYNFHVRFKKWKKDNRETKQWLDNHVKCVKSIIIAIQVPFHSGHLVIKLRSSQVDDDWKYWSNWITSNVNDVLTLLMFYLWPAHIRLLYYAQYCHHETKHRRVVICVK